MNADAGPCDLLNDEVPLDAATNMARDEALLQLATAPTLRFYRWATPCVTIGYFQSHSVVPDGMDFVRRYTGGGLVDHTADFTYSLTAPRNSTLGGLSTEASYSLIHRAIASALQAVGIPVQLAESCVETDAPGCFQKPVRFDVLLDSEKLAGAAQRRTRRAMLHQGSIQLTSLPTVSRSQLAAALLTAFETSLGLSILPRDWSTEELTLATQLREERYAQNPWNYER